jgi:cation:H+ antiporter
VGNVVGSNIFNIAVILGLASVIRPVRAETLAIRRDAPVMIGVTLSGLAVLRDGDVTRLEGAALLLASVFYTVWIVRQARKERVEDDDSQSCLSLTRALIYLAIGLALLAVGSRLLVVNAVILARGWGVSEAVIGLTIIAAGTSMPELATSVVGALRGQSDIAVGNVIGSNIFNLLFVLGAAALIYPIEGARIRPVDQAFLVVTALVLWPIMRSGRTVARREGWLLLGSYGLYLVLMWPKG